MSLRRRGYLTERAELLTAQKVQALRKDFLTLMKNVKTITTNNDLKQIDKWRSAMGRWGAHFEELMVQIKRDIEARVRFQSGKQEWEKTVNENDAKYLLKTMGDVWEFTYGVASVPGNSLAFYREWNLKNDNWWTDARILGRFLDDVKSWERRIRTKSRKTWKWLDEVARWTQQTGLNSGGGEAVKLNVPETRNLSLSGFRVQLRSYLESDTNRRMIRDLERGLALYKKRVAKILPHMLRATLPIVIDFEGGHGSYAAQYNYDHITMNIWGATGTPKEVTKVIAHEMGHHVWREFLSGQAQKAWEEFTRGATTNLNLRDVVKKWDGVRSKEIERKDPILALQLETLLHDPRYSSLDLISVRSIKTYLEQGGDPIVKVTTRPITGYAGKSPEEAFCEALGMLVAYGPKTVLPSVRKMMEIILPKLRTESSDLRRRGYLVENKVSAIGKLNPGDLLSDLIGDVYVYVYRWVPDYADNVIRPKDYVLLDPKEGQHYGGKRAKRLTARISSKFLEYRQGDEYHYVGGRPKRAAMYQSEKK